MEQQLIDWDDAFDNSGYVAGSDLLADKWSGQAASFRQNMSRRGLAELDLKYGNKPRNHLDLFRPDCPCKGLFLFVHGGYWHLLDKSFWSHLAAGMLSHGYAVAIPSYSLAPEVRISQIGQEIAAAITHAGSIITGPIRLAGHSAGGHLVARMATKNGPLPSTMQSRMARLVPMSGIYDLRPLLLTKMNETLLLTKEEAQAESPALHQPQPDIPVTFWVGAEERPEFLRQNRLICENWNLHNSHCRSRYEDGENHFSLVESLADPQSDLVGEILRD